MQADMVLEKELRGLRLDPQATGSELRHWVLVEPTPTVTYFLKQTHTYSDKTIPLNSATPYELMGVNSIPITIPASFC